MAVKSGAYLYPIKVTGPRIRPRRSRANTFSAQGIVYFVTHKALWKPLMSKLVPTMTLSVAVVAFMFAVVYVPQAIVLAFVNGPLSALTSVLLTLSESSTIVTILSKNFLIADALVDTFDGTLVAQNQTGIVSEGRQLKSGSDPISKVWWYP